MQNLTYIYIIHILVEIKFINNLDGTEYLISRLLLLSKLYFKLESFY